MAHDVDYDRVSYDDFIGHGVILLEDVPQTEGQYKDVWISLIDEHGTPLKGGGKIHLQLNYKPLL